MRVTLNDAFFATEKSFFVVQRVVVRMLGFWPGSDDIRPWQITFAIFNAIEILVYGIFQVNFCIHHTDDLMLVLNGITPFVTQFVMVFKIFILVRKRHDMKKIFDHLQNSFVNGKSK